MKRVKSRFPDHGKRIVLFEKQLLRSVEGDAMVGQAATDILCLFNDQRHRFLPRGFDQLSILAYQRIRKTVWMGDCSPSVFRQHRLLVWTLQKKGMFGFTDPLSPFGPRRPLLILSVTRPLTPTTLLSLTPISSPYPLLSELA